NLFMVNLRKVALTCGTDLRGADLRFAYLEDAWLDSSTQMDAKWRLVWELVTSGGYLRNLAGIDLSEADLSAADLFGTNLAGANLQGSLLYRTNLFGANLNGANLTAVTWNDTTCPDGSNSDNNGGTCEAHLESALPRDESFMIRNCLIVLPVNLPNGPFTDCADAELSYADLRQLDLRNALLLGADLTNADLRGADFTGADLRFAHFQNVTMNETTTIDEKWRLVWNIVSRGARGKDLSGIDLSSAALSFSDFTRATLVGVDFSNTLLIGANLTDANLTGAIWNNTICPDGTNSNNHAGTCINNLQL
ncbi:MAG: pentapeptide repeat-containing protein, partial [Anaerolineales bacterium]|nr:pentapeptide repeat-containing protein [Anaerolineales bacterium]